MTNRLVITDNASERIVIQRNDTLITLLHYNRLNGSNIVDKVFILNPVEAKKVADVILENLDAVSPAL